MVITYHGDNYFKIQSGNFTILIDPTNQRSFKGANLILNTLKPALVLPPNPTEENAPFWIDHQGEYEIADALITGWNAGFSKDLERTIYKIDFDEIKIAVLGYLNKELDPKTQNLLGEIDIMILPAGGKPYLEETSAVKLIKNFEPAIIIPSLFKDLKGFVKNLNQNNCQPQEKLVIKKKDIDSDRSQIVWLKA